MEKMNEINKFSTNAKMTRVHELMLFFLLKLTEMNKMCNKDELKGLKQTKK
jgi:hypothetical protein